MAEPRLHVARGDVALGLFSRSDIKELIEAGYLVPSDQCWTEGQAIRRTLEATFPPTAPTSQSWLNRAANATAGVASVMRNQAAALSEKVATSTGRQQARVKDQTSRLLEFSLPRIQQKVAEVLSRSMKSTSAALRDEVFLRKLFGAVYDTLPKPIYRFVSEEAFLAFCFKHQRKLLPPQRPPGSSEQLPKP